jgi:ABC-type sugar transport system substrate-binding protein
MSHRSHRVTTALVASALAAVALAPAVLAQDASPAAGGSPAAAAAPLAEGKSITILMPSSTNNYLAEWIRGAQEEADRQGITLRIVENNFDQAEQNVQAQQEIAAGTPPDLYGWWPADNNAGVATLQALAATGVPVIQVNQFPAAAAEWSWVAYAGVNDVLNGRTAGELLIQARDALVDAGTLELTSEGGNAIVVKFIAGYAAADDRMTGFHEVADPAGIVILGEEPAGFDAQTGYAASQGLVTANRDAGIDLVYAQNDPLAIGAIQALEEAGLQPGVDVAVVGGNCHGQLGALEDGKQYGTGLQAPFLEGLFSVNTMARYLANPTVAEGEYNAPADADALPDFPDQISTANFIPNPPVLATEIDDTSLWGYTVRELCSGF